MCERRHTRHRLALDDCAAPPTPGTVVSVRLEASRPDRWPPDEERPMTDPTPTSSPWPRRRVLSMGAFGLAAAALAAMGCKNDGRPGGAGPEKVRLALDWTPNTNHTGFWVAEKQGWYKDAGIAFEALPYGETSPEVLV